MKEKCYKNQKILYALQATGNGHINRACELIPALRNKAQVDILVSGTSADLKLPFEPTYQFEGMSFTFGKNGGIDFWKTFKKMNSFQLLKDIWQLPVEKYDLIISDFEPISAWAARLKNKKSVGLSNQEALKLPNAPKPSYRDWFSDFVIRNYAPSSIGYGFHFLPLNERTFHPIIRDEIKQLKITESDHYTVYLPSYDDKQLIKFCQHFFYINWQIFSKHTQKEYQIDNVHIRSIDRKAFLESLSSCKGFVCGGGFEAPSEALYLGKKLLIVPMKNQYEQHYNAAGLAALGVKVIKNIKAKRYSIIEKWLESDKAVQVDFESSVEKVIDTVLSHCPEKRVSVSQVIPHWSPAPSLEVR